MPTVLTISQGGTSNTDASAVRNALGLGTAAVANMSSDLSLKDTTTCATIAAVSNVSDAVDLLTGYFTNVSGTKVLSLTHGGLGTTSLEAAKSLLGITELANKFPISVSNGGTGSTTQTSACKAILPETNRTDGKVLQVSSGDIVWADPPIGSSNVKTINITGGAIGSGNINFNGQSNVSVKIDSLDPTYLNKVPVTNGGTGATSVAEVFTNFGLKSGAKTDIIVDSTEPNAASYADGTIWIQFTHEVSSV